MLSDGERCEESGQCASGCCRSTFLGCLFNSGGTCGPTSFLSWCIRDVDLKITGSVTESQLEPVQSAVGTFKVMSYNIFLIKSAPDFGFFGIFGSTMPQRINEIGSFFLTRGEDVVVLQEVWWHRNRVRELMLEAGFSHYAYDDRSQSRDGSGLALYSKLPIEKHDFLPFTNSKGIIYAKVATTNKPIHIFATHMEGDDAEVGDKHDIRRQEYAIMRCFVEEKVESDDELVLMLGDFNEEKNLTPENYATMLADLGTGEFTLNGADISWNDPESTFFREEWPPMTLDFVFYDRTSSAIPGEGSQCEYLKPLDEEGNFLSDHFPIACTIELPWNQLR